MSPRPNEDSWNPKTPFGPAKQEANGVASAGKSIRLSLDFLEGRFMKVLIPSVVFAFLLSLAVVPGSADTVKDYHIGIPAPSTG
jgi:hypothetical protein